MSLPLFYPIANLELLHAVGEVFAVVVVVVAVAVVDVAVVVAVAIADAVMLLPSLLLL